MYTQVSDLNAAHIYICMPACMCVSVCVCVCSIPVRCCKIFYSLSQLFACVALFGCCCPPSTPYHHPPISRSLLNAFSLFRYFVYFVFVIVFFSQQTSPPQNWPIRVRHLQRARPRLRLSESKRVENGR